MLARTLLQKSSQTLFDLLFPPRCVNCDRPAGWLCDDCLARIATISPQVCERCGKPVIDQNFSFCPQCRRNPLRAIDGIRAASYFEDNPIRPAIHALKYRNQKVIAATLGGLMADAYRRFSLTADVILPVPLHPARLRERGYNQSELLAAEVGRRLDLPVNTRALQRTRNTRSQMTLEAKDRHQNVANAFSCVPGAVDAKNVVLIDDVCTTGSTLDACAMALKEGGVIMVWGLTLARAR